MNFILSDRISTYIDNAAEPVTAAEAVGRDGRTDRRAPRALLVVALVGFVIVAGVAVAGLQRWDHNGPGPVTTEPNAVDAARRQQALEESAADFESGFARYPYADPSTGENQVGYLPTFSSQSSLAPMYDQVNKRVPIFGDRSVNSEVVGYDYSWIGFVPAAVANAGNYDARSVRISIYGCDPLDEDVSAGKSCSETSSQHGPGTEVP